MKCKKIAVLVVWASLMVGTMIYPNDTAAVICWFAGLATAIYAGFVFGEKWKL